MKQLIILSIIYVVAQALPAQGATVQRMVETRAEQVLGRQWVGTAVLLARKESGFRCNAVGPRTRHGRALGVFQVMPGSAKALGYQYKKLVDCRYGIDAGLAHMKLCLAHGVRTERQMMSCHLRGVAGWRKASR
jgi:hypothetical protein